jgi:DNA-binding NtrC family response regulator
LRLPPGWGSAVFGNGNARVLIVEDSEIQRTLLADLVRLWGYDTETASDGLEALEKIPLFRPKVVISDLQMPGMGGIELLKALRSRVSDVACVIVTGHGSLEKAETVTALGAIDCLEKPVDLERLRADLLRLATGEGAGPQGSLLHNPAQAA